MPCLWREVRLRRVSHQHLSREGRFTGPLQPLRLDHRDRSSHPELRYTQGDIAYIDLLDVRRGLFAAQIDLVAAERDALLNTVDLALAVGGGLGDKAEPLSAKR